MEGSTLRDEKRKCGGLRAGDAGRDGKGCKGGLVEEPAGFPTGRAVLVGFLLAGFIAIFPTYARIAGRTSKLPAHGLLTALVVLIAVNFVVKFIRANSRLSSQEMIFAMMIVVMAMGLVLGDVPLYLIALMASPHYFASSANQWDTYLLPNLPGYLFPTNEGGEMSSFFKGLGGGEMIPWAAWAAPLFWWFSLLAAMQLCALCAMVILRKQWVVRERLVFPLAEVSVQVAHQASAKELFPPMLRSKAFWVGVAIPGGALLWNVAAHFHPGLPRIRFQLGGKPNFIPARYFPPIWTVLDPMVVGLAFFANLQVLFSVWFFALLAALQVGIANRIGLFMGGMQGGVSGVVGIGWQSFGGMTALVLVGLWRARRHLWGVMRKSFAGSSRMDDAEEIIPYRFAFLGFVGSMVYMAAWLYRAGMTPGFTAAILGGWLVMYLGVARIVSETGLLYVFSGLQPQFVATHLVGTVGMSARTTGALAAAQITFRGGYDSFMMTSAAHACKYADVMRRKRAVAATGYVAALGAAAAMTVTGIFLCYRYGAANFNLGPFNRPESFLGQVVNSAKNREGTNWPMMGFFLGGAGLVWILSTLMWRFPAWPIHPIGFTIAGVFPVQALFLSTFAAWVSKLVILKVGGIPAYRRAVPFYLGMIVGTVLGTLVSVITDLIWFPGSGHVAV